MNGFFCLGGTAMKSSVIKRSIVLGGHKTSVSLEDAFWNGLRNIASVRKETFVEHGRQHRCRSATRKSVICDPLFVLGFYRNRLGPQGSLAT